jgi:transcriptional regulator with XRE-family HTH domain
MENDVDVGLGSVNGSLADRVRAARLSRGLSLSELARKAALSKSYLHRLEAPGAPASPSVDVVMRLAAALQLEPNTLLARSSEQADLTPAAGLPQTLRQYALEAKLRPDQVELLSQVVRHFEADSTASRRRR